MPVKLPKWLRILAVVGVVLLAGGSGYYGYWRMTRPVTLTIAAGSVDGDAVRLMSAIASRMASSGAPVRLKVIDKATALAASQAFSAGEVDLAVVRADLGDLSGARTVVVVAHGVVMLIALPGSRIQSIEDLKAKTVGVIGGPANQRIVQVLDQEYDLTRAKVRFRDLMPAEVPAAIQSKQVQALLVVVPVSERYLAIIRDFFARDAKRRSTLIAIDSASAISAVAPAYESYELPKGTIRGSPPIPDDDLTTLRVPLYLVAKQKLDKDVVTALARSLMQMRRDLVAEHPLLAQISAPELDKDAAIPAHGGAAAFFNGDEQTLFDKYGDYFWYGSVAIGMLTSAGAALWKFMVSDQSGGRGPALDRLYDMIGRIRETQSTDELDVIEDEINEILRSELAAIAKGESDASALGGAVHRLEYLIGQRRRLLDVQMARS